MNQWLAKPIVEVEWKSDWRKEFERRSAEEAAKEREMERARKVARERSVKEAVQQAREQREPKMPKPREKKCMVPTKWCAECSTPLRADNSSGLCDKHRSVVYKRAWRLNKKGPAPQCGECGKTLRRDNKSGLCDKHSKLPRQLAYLERKRQERQAA